MTLSDGISKSNSDFLDPTFGLDGKIGHSFPGTRSCEAMGIAVQHDGKIILGATTHGDDRAQFGLIGLHEDGSINPEFGGPKYQGFVRGNFLPGVMALGGPVKILKDGTILLFGYNYLEPFGFQHVIAKFLKNGYRDLSWGNNGQIIIDLPVKRAHPDYLGNQPLLSDLFADGDVTVQPDGKILLTSIIAEGSGVIMRFNSDGTADESFNKIGYVVVNYLKQPTRLTGHIVQSDGKIVVYGGAGDHVENGLLARLSDNGNIDRSFGKDGFSIATVPNHSMFFSHVVPKEDGRLVAMGVAYTQPNDTLGTNDCVITGFTKNGQPDYMFNRGTPVITEARKGLCYWKDGISSTGNTTTAVGMTLSIDSSTQTEILVGRYTETGRLDQSFADGVGWRMISVFGKGDSAAACTLSTDGKLLIAGHSWMPNNTATVIRLQKS
ncbi:hypothetical protein [Pseudomonas izuensis]|uniref:Delta-60 repeat domain-containing protein n=1 Tax=Pseudomonas izuensis TaxID=2684212 RepID=A0ABM7RW29_9PSED|nr:hypothetical protein [Pseudomonas izuensis]BCX69915.1 hypothetical protein LAB08_R45720 [Pseudomonas izuensis]